MAKTNRSKSAVAADIARVTGILYALRDLSIRFDSHDMQEMDTLATCVEQLAVRGGDMLNDCIRKLDATHVSYTFGDQST